MTHAFARDGGIPFSKFFSRTNSQGVPVPCVILGTVCVIIFGLIYLGSSAALNAILSSSVVFLYVSYSIPVIIILARGRHILRPPSLPEPTWTLGPILGPITNWIAVLFTLFTTVFFLFPPGLPVNGTNMNYAVVVFGIIRKSHQHQLAKLMVVIISVITWVVDGHKNFTGPRDIDALMALANSDEPIRIVGGMEATEDKSQHRSKVETVAP